PGSVVQILSDKGKAIEGQAGASNSRISVKNGATFIAHGATPVNNTNAIFEAGTGFQFIVDKPLYYDFANTREGGGRIVNSGTGSSYVNTYSDLSLWKSDTGAGGAGRGNPISGNPYKDWTLPTFTLSGANLNTLVESDDSTLNTQADSFGNQGLVPYTRMSGNNATPVITESLEATNADKYVRWAGTVAEGTTFGSRPFWTDEILGRIEITKNGVTTTSTAGQLTSYNPDELYSVQTGVRSVPGAIRYDNGGFLVPGDSYKISSLWRGSIDDPSSNKIHKAVLDDLPTEATVVVDKLPPLPATIEAPGSGKMWAGITDTVTGTWSTASAQAAAEPHNTDVATKIIAVKTDAAGANPVRIETGGTLNDNGTWSFVFEDVSGFAEGDRVYFVLIDGAGNENPLVATPFHDTTLAAAPYLTVSQPDLVPTSKSKIIGLDEAYDIAASTDKNDSLLDLIEANFVWRVGPVSGLVEGAEVTGSSPEWGATGEYGNRGGSAAAIADDKKIKDDFLLANPDGKKYTVNFRSVSDHSLTSTEEVTVLPTRTPYIDANSFEISAENAITLMAKSDEARNAELITRAAATARPDLTTPWDPSYVRVGAVEIPRDNPLPGVAYDVTFYVAGHQGEEQYTTTVRALIKTDPYTPIILVDPNPIRLYTGNSATLPAAYDLRAANYHDMYGVTAFDHAGAGAPDITDQVVVSGTVDITTEGVYSVSYSVLNSDGRTATVVRNVVVGSWVVDGDYAVTGWNFVTTLDEVAKSGNLDNTITGASFAEAWLLPTDKPKESEPVVVKDKSQLMADPLTEGNKNVQLGVNADAPYTGNPIQNVTATVVDRDVVARGLVTDDKFKYAVVASHAVIPFAEVGDYIGTGATAQANLATAAGAIGYEFSKNVDNPGQPGVTNAAYGVEVVENGIPADPVPNGEYKVVFTPTGKPEIRAEVTVKVGSDEDPVIEFGKNPLVVDQTQTPHVLTDTELKAAVTVSDVEDMVMGLTPALEAVVLGESGLPLIAGIDTRDIGVYKVRYTATDSTGNSVSADRALVV
ncbi:MAG TPA: hypothetical protein DEB24_07710, partial [Coriobacteriia bacterium]|nr:hypothetical protein [Coriobacteriia bacterium]